MMASKGSIVSLEEDMARQYVRHKDILDTLPPQRFANPTTKKEIVQNEIFKILSVIHSTLLIQLAAAEK